MAGNISISTGVETPAQSRTSVSGGFSLPARPAPAPAPAGYQLVYQMGGPRYMYGETPRYGAYYSDGGTVPGQIYGNMRGSREGADMFGFFPTMFQSQPYATASQMYTPSLGVMPLIGYPSKYPHVVMGGYTDYGAPIANQAINMMLPLLMMGLYRQMFPMPGMGAAPAVATKGSGGGGGGGKSGGGSGGGSSVPASSNIPDGRNGHYQNLEEALAQPDSGRVYDYQGFDPDYAMRGVSRQGSSSARTSDDMQGRVQADIERVRRERAEQEARDATLPWYTRAANTFNKYAALGPWAGGLRLAGDTIDYLYTR